jgi:hypothetical protein
MNERIEKFSEQARLYADSMYPSGLDIAKWGPAYQEKFAELIVKECLEELRYTVLDTQELRRDKSTDYQVGWEDGMFDAGETIKNIFGVEE